MVKATPPTISRWQVFGTTAVLVVNRADELAPARTAIIPVLKAIDRSCSRFRADSEIARVNAAVGKRIAITQLFSDVCALALQAAALTDGDLDPTVGLCLRAIGYDRDFSQVGGRAQIRFAPAAGFTCVDLDENALTIQLPPGVELDFGAIAKAYAVDLSVAAANAFAPSGLLFSIGGDLALDGPTPEGGWPVRVCEDHRADATAPGQTVALDAGALATSSTTTRSWHQRGHNLHHILDPTSGRPVLPHWRTVSTTAANCVEANVASTTAIIRRRGAEDWLAASNRPARLVDLNSHPLTVGGWPQ